MAADLLVHNVRPLGGTSDVESAPLMRLLEEEQRRALESVK
jgi:hypothetical protein